MKIQREHIGTPNKLRVISTNGSHGAHQGFSVEPGETYTFEIDLHRPAGMNKEINVVIWKNTGPSGALSVHVINTNGTNTFTYNATSSDIFIQIRQAGTYYLDNIRMYRTYQDTIFVSGYEMDMAYRYGFNSMKRDNEVKGQGNSYTTEFRQYDSRLGRWLSIDPLFTNFPWQSPYVGFDNNPIYYVDPKGLAAEGAETHFVNEEGETLANTDDGSSEVFVIRKENEDGFIKELLAKVETKEDLNPETHDGWGSDPMSTPAGNHDINQSHYDNYGRVFSELQGMYRLLYGVDVNVETGELIGTGQEGLTDEEKTQKSRSPRTL